MIRTTIKSVGGPASIRKAMRREIKAALAEAGISWHRVILPQHFQIRAEKRYGYQPRDPDYARGKAKRKGHRRPLVYTGALEYAVTAAARVSGSSRRANVRLSGPRYLYAYRKDVSQPDKAAELTAVDQSDERFVGAILDSHVTKRFRENREVEIIRG